jgi:hypothetical protein
MKKIFLLLTVFSMVFASCDPLEDINTEIDAIDNPIVGDASIKLTDDDYSDLGLNFGSFSSIDDAKADLPAFLTDKYPAWGKGSSVLVDYKLYRGNAFSVKNYSLDQDDYNTSGSTLLGFESTATPSDYLAAIIASNYPNEEGVFVAAQYFQYTGSAYTVSPEVSLEENLDYGTTAGDLTTISGGDWVKHSGSSTVLYAAENLTMANYPSSNVGGAMSISSSKSEDVNHAITPIITTRKVYTSALVKLSTVGSGTYFFHLMEQDGSYNYSARVGAKDNGSGKILFGIGASSSSLTYGTTAFDLDTTYLIVTSYDTETGVSNLYVLTSAATSEPTTPESTNTGNTGNTAQRIGIRQGGGGPTALIDGIRVANTWSAIMNNGILGDEVVGTKESATANYAYINGAWAVPPSTGYYSVSAEDFTSMGIENFGSGTPADDYLATFLNIKFPYAEVGQELAVLYKYVSSSSGAQVRGDFYTKTDGNTWTEYQSTVDTVLQFGHEGNGWVPDNTIKYTLTRGSNSDYDWIADQLTTPEYAGLIGNLSSYDDFDYNWSDTQIRDAMLLFIEHHAPNAEEGQKDLLTYVKYDNGENELKLSVKKVGGVWIENK